MDSNKQLENTQQIIQDGYFKYQINEVTKTAGVFRGILRANIIKIPTTVRYKSQTYIITSILEGCFTKFNNLKTIKFSSDSKIQTIEKSAFSESSIESLSIPETLIELNEGWCNETSKLTKIEVNPKNPRYSTLGKNNMIFGKSSSEKVDYDSFVFCARDIKNITIPNFIEIIEPYAFNRCSQLFEIIFPLDSKIQSIGYSAFSNTPIKTFTIPPSLIDLKKGWCEKTPNLNEIKIVPNNLRYSLFDDKFLIGKSSLENENYDILAFSVRDIEIANIPSFIEIIDHSAFQQCAKLKEVKFSNDSKLRIIEKFAFNNTSIRTFSMPSQVKSIGKGSFLGNARLTNIEIPIDSKLQTIENQAFCLTSLKKFSISHHITSIGSNAFRFCKRIKQVEIPVDSQLQKIGVNAFEATSIESIFIPCHITQITDYTFSLCRNLRRVEIPFNSKVETIGKFAFYKSSIEKFSFPAQITKICESAFKECQFLKRIDIPFNSELQIIENEAFNFSSIHCIVFPPHLTLIGDDAFSNCHKLKIIEINGDSELKSINYKMFAHNDYLAIYVDVSLKLTIQ